MSLFNFNGDGKTDDFERAARFCAAMERDKEEKKEALIAAGLDPEELAEMDCFARRETLEQAGFDPDEYAF